jgi:hypothetical protein
MTTFKESRMAQIVNALREARAEQAEQVDRITPKTEAQLEADRSAAAIVLSAALLRQREARFGEVAPKVTALEKAVDALSSALERARATQAQE